MSARIKIATTPEEIDAVFQVRHRVYVDEEGYMERRPDGRIFDRFDALPTAANIIAIVGDRVVGTMRFQESSVVGTSADTFFDFDSCLAKRGLGRDARVGAASQLAVERAYRKHPGLSFSLMAMGYYWAISRGLTHVKGAANPDALSIFRGTGWEPIAPEFYHDEYKLRVVPLLLDLSMLNDRFFDFVSRQDMQHYLRSFERQFHGRGETVVEAGDVAREAFVIVHGEAVVLGADGREIARLGPGEVFGELALIAGSRRTATVVAGTDLDLMVLSRESFEQQISTDPAVAVKLLRLVASRVAPPTPSVREPGSRVAAELGRSPPASAAGYHAGRTSLRCGTVPRSSSASPPMPGSRARSPAGSPSASTASPTSTPAPPPASPSDPTSATSTTSTTSAVQLASCPSGMVVTRMTGKAGSWVDSVAFSCSAPSIVRNGDP